jgi:FtsH-binding integral membrane protein
MGYIIAFCALCATAGTLGVIAAFTIKDQTKLEKVAINGFLGVVNASLLLLLLGLLP